MDSIKRVPALRFPGFSDDWEHKPIGKVTKIYDGTHMTPDYKESGVAFYSVEHITSNNFTNTKFIAEDVFEKENKRVKLEKGDILMTRIGDIGTAKYIDWDVRASFYVSLALLKKTKSNNTKYLNQYINTSLFKKELYKKTIHVAFPKKINLGDISHCVVGLCSPDEQQGIADFLTCIDKRFDQLTKKKELLLKFKKGMMQKLFSQEIRFKDDSGKNYPDWEFEEFEVLVNKSSSKYDPDKEDKDYECVELESLSQESGMLLKTFKAKDLKSIKNKFNKGEILFGKLRPYLRKYLKAEFDGVCSSEIWVFRGKKLINGFLYYLIQTNRFNYVANVSAGSKMPRSDWDYVSSSPFHYPCKEEQEKIANFLTEIDKKINLVDKELEETKKYKKSLLQQMFI